MKKIVNPNWIPKNGKISLRIEIIDPSDLELITYFYNDHYVNHGNLWKSIKITSKECHPLSFDIVSLAIEKPVSLAAFDGNQLVAVQLNRVQSPDEFSKLFDGQLHHENPKLVIKDDYAKDIKNGPYNLQANRIYVILQETLKQAGKFLPKTTKNLGYFKAASVHPDYQKFGLGSYLGIESLKLFHVHHCEYIMGFTSVDATYKFSKKLGMKECFELPYSKYKKIQSLFLVNYQKREDC
uniref:N-acetyltransferase domain-containing protein n=1 Tax=Panagrolaimus superbus TaxID=310955 RepID=A0A914ZFC1_9BILA